MKFSIITVCFNNLKGLEKTIESVKKQVYRDFEFIVIDGGSTDGTLELLKKNSSLFAYWVSEKDNGIYHAMNKGISKSKGDYCLFLNSGDYLFSEEILQKFIISSANEDIVYGNVLKVKPHYKRVITYSPKLTLYDFYRNVSAIHHQATFINKNLFEKLGLYREDLRINSDWDFLFRAIILNGATTKYMNSIISVFDGNGMSETLPKNHPDNIIAREHKKELLESNFPEFILDDYRRLDIMMTKKNKLRKLSDKFTYFSLRR